MMLRIQYYPEIAFSSIHVLAFCIFTENACSRQ